MTPKCPKCGWHLEVKAAKITRSTRPANVGQIVWSVRCWNKNCSRTTIEPREVFHGNN
jgi:hypothetical protein